jgi:hypothetical protein
MASNGSGLSGCAGSCFRTSPVRARHQRAIDVRAVGDPVDDLVAGRAKFFWCHPSDSMAIVFTVKLAEANHRAHPRIGCTD